jgi:hypothetical protein
MPKDSVLKSEAPVVFAALLPSVEHEQPLRRAIAGLRMLPRTYSYPLHFHAKLEEPRGCGP